MYLVMMPGFKPINTFPVIFLDVVVVVVSWVSTSGNKFAFVCLQIAFKNIPSFSVNYNVSNGKRLSGATFVATYMVLKTHQKSLQ